MGRSLFVAVSLLLWASCKRDSPAWPPADVAAVETQCTADLGEPSACPCFANEVATQLPLARMTAFIAAADRTKGFTDVFHVMAAATRKCATQRDAGVWTAVARRGFIEGCVKGLDSAASCECIAGVVERRVPFALVIEEGYARQAGESTANSSRAAASSLEAAACHAPADSAPWPDDARARALKECEANQDVPNGMCPCFVKRMVRDISWAQMYLLATGADGGSAVNVAIYKHNEGWVDECADELGLKRTKP